MAVKRRAFQVILAVFFMIGLLAVMPIAPVFPDALIDTSWAYAMNEAVARGMVFGRDMIFTYGPYASLFTRLYHPGTDNLMLGGALVIGVAWMLMVVAQLRYSPKSFMWLWPAMLIGFVRDAPFFMLPIFYLATAARAALPPDHPDRIDHDALTRVALLIGAAALGIIPLVKGTFAISVGPALFLAPAMLWRRWRRSVVTLPVFFCSMALAWQFAGQPIEALPLFFHAQLPIVSGYAGAMSLPAHAYEVWLTAVCISVLLLASWQFCERAGFVTWAWRVGFVFVLFLSVKAGFVRADAHVMMTMSLVVMCVVLVTARRPAVAAVALAVTCGGYWYIDQSYWQFENGSFFQRVSRETYAILTSPTWVGSRGEALESSFSDHLRQIREKNPLLSIDGTADIYPIDISILLAYGLRWTPRPVTQSYSAYTSSLANIDARHLSDENAPQHLFFGIAPIDGRFPTIEDGPSWIPLLTRYHPKKFVNEYALMDRTSNAPRAAVGSTMELRLNEATTIPKTENPLFVRIDIQPTLLGQVLNALLKNSRIELQVTLVDGRSLTYWMPPDMARAGFVLSPLVQSKLDLVALYTDERQEYFQNLRVQTIRVRASESHWSQKITTVFSTIPVARNKLANAIMMTSQVPGNLAPAIGADAECSPPMINGESLLSISTVTGKTLRVDGWAVWSRKNGIAPETAAVTLTGLDKRTVRMPAHLQFRRDVNAHFEKPAMGPAGYIAWFDVAPLRGDYLLDVQLTKGGQTLSCGIQKHIRIAG
ncbi:hypothetical protein [Paraburkholderia fungorum]|uniref:hypothetical protein n=1 Tax=Paraburkholderia fungorum TaxID=134537 RepID=UPI001611DD85|nr:hypothetical protein [Paraburkholderia fungorum]MBB5543041.1 hypothetical protein [Paraburkholderia fungorum]